MRAKVNVDKDPCLRPFFIRDEALLGDWAHIHLWNPTVDKIDVTASDILLNFGSDWIATGYGLQLRDGRGISCNFFGVN